MYVMYHNAARGGVSQGHGDVHKKLGGEDRTSSSRYTGCPLTWRSGETEISVMTKGDQETLSRNCRMQENLFAAAPSPTTSPPIVDHSVEQYIHEALPALLEKSGNLICSGK